MKLRWVNHASFVVEWEGVALLCDPWLFGRAFNEASGSPNVLVAGALGS